MSKIETKIKAAEAFLTNPLTSPLVPANRINRRSLLGRAGLVGAAALGAGLLGESTPSADAAEATTFGPKGHKIAVNDEDILNFALNLEYLEAEFYQRAAYGVGLPATLTGPGGAKGTGTTGTVTGPTTAVDFGTNTAVMQYAQEIANDEITHVKFLRTALGKFAVAEPSIDVSDAVFTAAANAAGITGAFSPYASPTAFILGAFVFEDVGVTAYHGAAPFIKNPAYLSAAAGILAVEAYHAAEVRLQLLQAGDPYITYANDISALRDAASAAADGVQGTDQGVTVGGVANITPVDANAIAFARSFAAVLNIVYLNATATPVSGGFFPNGLNGRISSLAVPVKTKKA